MKPTLFYVFLSTLTNFTFIIPTLLKVSTEQLALYAQVLIWCQIVGTTITPGIVEVNLEKKLILQRRKKIRKTYLSELLAIRLIFLSITGAILVIIVQKPELVAAVCVTTFIMMAYNDFYEMMVISQLNHLALVFASIGSVISAITVTIGDLVVPESPLYTVLGSVAVSQAIILLVFSFYIGYKPVLLNFKVITRWNTKYFGLGAFQTINRNIDRITIYGLSSDETIANYEVAQRFKSFFLNGQNIVSRIFQQELAGLKPDTTKMTKYAFLLMLIAIALTYASWQHADHYLLNYLGSERQNTFFYILLWGIYCSLLFFNSILSKIFISKALVKVNLRLHFIIQCMNLFGVICIILINVTWYIFYLIAVQILMGVYRYSYIRGLKENIST